MDEEQQPAEGTSDDSDTTTDEQPTSRPVTVPNVTPGAKSGLAHEVIGSAAQEAYDATAGDEKDTEDDDAELEVPEGDLDSRLEWVKSAEDSDTARARADAVYAHEKDVDDGTDLEALSGALTSIVYGHPATEHIGSVADGEQPVAEVPATQVVTGDGSGETLPPIPDDGTSKPLSEPGSDSVDGSADETPIDSPAAEDAAQGTESGDSSTGDEAASS